MYIHWFSDVNMPVINKTAYTLGWGRMKPLCTSGKAGPRAAHMCNKWFKWKSNVNFMIKT